MMADREERSPTYHDGTRLVSRSTAVHVHTSPDSESSRRSTGTLQALAWQNDQISSAWE